MDALWNYRAVREARCNSELGFYFTYGLQARRKVGQDWEQIELVHDVTTDGLLAGKMAGLFAFCQISPIHLRDAIEDLLP